jgi:PAS domain S-box-containing protein
MQPSILVVENEVVVALDIQGRLRRLGYRVAGMATSGEDALAMVPTVRPDLVLMDIALDTDMDGVETATAMREQFHIPVVFLTAYSNSEMLDRVRLSKPYAYLLKPFEEPELHVAIEIALARNQVDVQQEESQRLLVATLSSIGDGVIVTGEDGCVRFMNPVAESLTGWSRTEALGTPFHAVFVLKGGDELVARNGIRRRVETRRNPMKDSSGNVLGFVHAFTDVTEAAAARAAISERDIDYRTLMEQAVDAIVLTDSEGRFLAVNSKVCELTGYSRDELLTMKAGDIVDPAQLSYDSIQLNDLHTGKVISRERRIRQKDGSIFVAEINAKEIAGGRIQGILRDITDRKNSEQDFKDAVHSEVVDKLMSRLHAFRHGESGAMMLNRIALFMENIGDLFEISRDSNLAGASPIQRFRHAVEEYTGVVAQQLLRVSALTSALESDPGLPCTVKQIDGSASRLRTATQVLQENLSALALILSGGVDAEREEQRHVLSRAVLDAIDTIRATLHRVSETLTSELTSDVPKILSLTLEKFRPPAGTIQLLFENDSAPKRAIISSADLDTVISNLLQNALEAMETTEGDPAGWICVRALSVEGHVRIEVEDNGPGIPPEECERIFDDNFSTKGTGRGFGLGYALRCLNSCGGVIRCGPAGGPGALFVIDLVQA